MATPEQERQGGILRGLWRFGRHASKDVVVTPIGPLTPKPDLIDVKSHPLRFYPDFEEFATEWNQYASTDRLAIQSHAAEARLKLQQMTSSLPGLRRELADVTKERTSREEAYAAVKDDMSIPRKEKYTPVKDARRVERRKREELEKVERLERPVREPLEAAANTESIRLRESEEEWALAKDENRALYYAVEHLRDDESAREALFMKFIEKEAVTDRLPQHRLGGLYYRFASIVEDNFTHEKAPDLIHHFFEMAERAWYQKHPEDRPSHGRTASVVPTTLDSHGDIEHPSQGIRGRTLTARPVSPPLTPPRSMEELSPTGKRLVTYAMLGSMGRSPNEVRPQEIPRKPADATFVISQIDNIPAVTANTYEEFMRAMERFRGKVPSYPFPYIWNKFCSMSRYGVKNAKNVTRIEGTNEYSVIMGERVEMFVEVEDKKYTLLRLAMRHSDNQ